MIARIFFLLSIMAGFSASAGVRWHWSNPLPHGNNIISLGYHAASGLAIEACESGQIYTSSDWSAWDPQDSHTTNALQSIACLKNRVLITGENGTVLYSDDAINYVCTNVGTSDWLVGVAASPSLAVAVGDEAAIYTSRDGAWWTRQPAPPNIGSRWLLAVGYGGGVFVAVGESGYIAISRDGTNWTSRTVSGQTANLNAVSWLGTQTELSGLPSNSFLVAGDSGKTIVSSNYGTNWTTVTGTGTNTIYGISGNDSAHILTGNTTTRLGREVLGSLVWREQVGGGFLAVPSLTYYSAQASSNAWLIGGDDGLYVVGQPNPTSGALDWSVGGSGPRNWLFDVISVNGSYIAVGQQAGILSSDNGADWSIEEVPSTNSVSSTNTVFFGVGGSTNVVLAVGNSGSVAMSTNLMVSAITTNSDGTLSTNLISTLGLVWTPIPAPTTNDLHAAIQFNGTNYICGGSGTILASGNGVNWTKCSTATTAYLSGLGSYSGGLICVGDTGVILTSPDGRTWTKRTSGTTNWIFRVRNFGGTLIAVGENGTILSSTNAIKWTALSSGVQSWLNDVAVIAGKCFIVGNDGTVLSSTNYSTWTSDSSISENSLYGMASQNGQLIAVGASGSILRSQIVPSKTPIKFLNYARLDNMDYFQAAGDLDESFTLDSSIDLSEWITGPQITIPDSSGTVIFSVDSPANDATFYRAIAVP